MLKMFHSRVAVSSDLEGRVGNVRVYKINGVVEGIGIFEVTRHVIVGKSFMLISQESEIEEKPKAGDSFLAFFNKTKKSVLTFPFT